MGKGTRKVRICRIPASIGHSGEMFYAMLFAKNYVGTTLVVVQISGQGQALSLHKCGIFVVFDKFNRMLR